MFGLDAGDTTAVATFAVALLGILVRISVQAGRVLQKLAVIEHRLHDHEVRIRAVERGPKPYLPYGVPDG